MTLYFLILAFCLVPAYSYESFIKYANGPTTITCDKNSFIVTNDTKYIKCNEERSCLIRKNAKNLHYVCLKKTFKRSGCTELKDDTEVNQTGCYVGKGGNSFEILLAKNSAKYFHFFVLEMSLYGYDQQSQQSYCPAFCYYKYNDAYRISLDGHSWILLKVSNKSEEDFGEFFMEKNSGTTFMGKEEGNRDPVTTAPTTSILPVNTMNIILGAVVIILLIVFMPVALAFYRKKLQNAKRTPNTETTKAMNEIPLSESVYDVIN